MNTTRMGGAAVPDSPLGEDFDDYLARVEVAFTPKQRALYETYDAHYRLASQALAMRKAKGWSQSDLAHQSGVHQSEISRLERGQANLSQASLQRIAHAFGAQLGFVSPRGALPARARPA